MIILPLCTLCVELGYCGMRMPQCPQRKKGKKLMLCRFILSIAIAGLIALPAWAQFFLPPPNIISTPASSYSGPGDIASGAFLWAGLRGYNTAFSGNVADVCDQSTGLVCGTATWAGSTLTFPTIGGLACNDSTNICVVSKLYDQSGNGRDLIQTTNANRPVLVVSCISSKPCMSFNGSSQFLKCASCGSTQAQPHSQSGVGKWTSGTNAPITQSANGGTGGPGNFHSAANTWQINDGSSCCSITKTDSTWYVFQALYNGASSKQQIDTSTATGSANTRVMGVDYYFANNQNNNRLGGNMTEGGFWASDISSNFNSLNTNAKAYWGI